jgi:hypothetical protein
MYGVPQAGLTVPAVAGQLERVVRPHSCYGSVALSLVRHSRCPVSAAVVAVAVLRRRGSATAQRLAKRVAGDRGDAHHSSAAAVPWWYRIC